MATAKKRTAADERAEKFPELNAQLLKLEKERDQIRAKVAPKRARRDALVAKIHPLEKQLRAIDEDIKALERPRLAELDNQIAALLRAMGALSLQAGA